MSTSSIRNIENWFHAERPKYEALAKAVSSTLENLIESAGIVGTSVAYRAKTPKSFSEKFEEKNTQTRNAR